MEQLISLGISVVAETNRDTDFSHIEGVIVGDRDAYADTVHLPTDADISDTAPDSRDFKEKLKITFKA